jgi:hypothetical protein
VWSIYAWKKSVNWGEPPRFPVPRRVNLRLPVEFRLVQLECGVSARYSTADLNLADAARWRVLANRLDGAERAPSDDVRSHVSRLEALLEDAFDASGKDLSEKTDSVRSRLSSDLRLELSVICGMQSEAAVSEATEAFCARCERVGVLLLCAAADAQPGTADGGLAYQQWMLRHPGIQGVVRKIYKYDDGLQHVAVIDLDGHLIELRTAKIIRMDRGDRVVLMRRGKHDATEYYNVTKKIGFEPPSNKAMYNFVSVGGVICMAGIVGIVVSALLAIRHIHGRNDLTLLVGYLLIGVPSVIAAGIGFVLLVIGKMVGGVMTEFRRAIAEETETTSAR